MFWGVYVGVPYLGTNPNPRSDFRWLEVEDGRDNNVISEKRTIRTRHHYPMQNHVHPRSSRHVSEFFHSWVLEYYEQEEEHDTNDNPKHAHNTPQ